MYRFLNNDKLYLDEWILGHNPEVIKNNIQNAPQKEKVTLLFLSDSKNTQLEAMESRYLKQAYYENQSILIVGMARNRKSARELMLRIVQDTLEHGMQTKVKEYLLSLSED